ncbi:pentatricopeptide repeat-containing protein At1g71210, mitochondrial-like [Arachis stenosperma]|uniref:pentatricopeptide repeat-containing protein At1g71210, mitochondrial-like n=1 Tax=Arachis stenosperma TaxID=217475 RepID=UPI0025AD0978|nr:pentatricopeptide repeat-containing protein At1g71210, mitochondrial-like [Arachis stenosperma]
MTMLQPLKHVTKGRSLFSSFLIHSIHPSSFSSSSSFSSNCHTVLRKINQNDVASFIKDWFSTRDPLITRIFQILSSTDSSNNDAALDASLSTLTLPRLDESFVLTVLHHGTAAAHVYPCLRFFHWAGRQPDFHHTRGTFSAIFRILARAPSGKDLDEFLQSFRRRDSAFYPRVRFHDTLVIGYAIAGKPEIALQVFGKMRFHGLDLDSFGYHVLLNALVDKDYFNAFDAIVRQIRMRGFENRYTNASVMKRLCYLGRLDEAEGFLFGLVDGGKELHGSEVSALVSALCGSNRFDHAVRLVRELGDLGLVPLDHAYGVWIKCLVQGGRLDEALEFFRQKKRDEGYIPSLARYNMLIYRLLRENRPDEAWDLLMDMYETAIPPNSVTMNAVLCFFCKAGMVDVALDLFKSRSEFMLSPNHMAYKYLILTLCWDGNAKEAFTVLKSSINHHYFPDRKTFTRLANVLCRECMIDEMKELLHLALERKIMPNASTYDNFIMALCRAGRVEDSYLIHGELKGASASRAYANMIKGFKELNRGDIAARLLVEMKEKGHKVTPALCRVVLCCLLQMDNSRSRFFSLFEMLSHNDRQHYIYDCFIDAAGHAKQAELAWNVYELMLRNGIQPTSSSQILMLKAYFKSGRTSDALNFFKHVWSRGLATKKLYNCLVVSLCKSKNPEPAYLLLKQMLSDGFHPSIECYENLVLALCLSKRYHKAVYLVNVYEKMGRRLTSSLGNILLSQSLSSLEVYNACVRLRGVKEEGGTDWSMLSFVVGAFHDHRSVSHVEDLEKLIAKCFPLNVYTYNLLLTKACKSDDMEQACKLFERMRRRGFEPNWRTYTTMLDGFERHGMRDKAERWFQESKRNYPTKEPE